MTIARRGSVSPASAYPPAPPEGHSRPMRVALRRCRLRRVLTDTKRPLRPLLGAASHRSLLDLSCPARHLSTHASPAPSSPLRGHKPPIVGKPPATPWPFHCRQNCALDLETRRFPR